MLLCHEDDEGAGIVATFARDGLDPTKDAVLPLMHVRGMEQCLIHRDQRLLPKLEGLRLHQIEHWELAAGSSPEPDVIRDSERAVVVHTGSIQHRPGPAVLPSKVMHPTTPRLLTDPERRGIGKIIARTPL